MSRIIEDKHSDETDKTMIISSIAEGEKDRLRMTYVLQGGAALALTTWVFREWIIRRCLNL